VWNSRVTNAEIRRRTNKKDSQFEWKWGGHVARMDELEWAQAASVWDVRLRKRSLGRSKTQWADSFKRAAGQWSGTAKNRCQW